MGSALLVACAPEGDANDEGADSAVAAIVHDGVISPGQITLANLDEYAMAAEDELRQDTCHGTDTDRGHVRGAWEGRQLDDVESDFCAGAPLKELARRRPGRTGVSPQSAHGFALSDGSLAPRALFGADVCGLLGSVKETRVSKVPIQQLFAPYFFVGGEVGGGAGVAGFVGADMVWDLFNQQFAVYTYSQKGVLFGISGGATAYEGFGYSHTSNSVHAAWSGNFLSADISIPVIPPFIGASVGTFSGQNNDGPVPLPDFGIFGGSVGVSVGLGKGIPGTPTVTTGLWGVWDDGVEMFRDGWDSAKVLGYPVIPTEFRSAVAADGKRHRLVQFKGRSDVRAGIALGTSILSVTGSAGMPGAAAALTTGILRSQVRPTAKCAGFRDNKCLLDVNVVERVLSQVCGI